MTNVQLSGNSGFSAASMAAAGATAGATAGGGAKPRAIYNDRVSLCDHVHSMTGGMGGGEPF